MASLTFEEGPVVRITVENSLLSSHAGSVVNRQVREKQRHTERRGQRKPKQGDTGRTTKGKKGLKVARSVQTEKEREAPETRIKKKKMAEEQRLTVWSRLWACSVCQLLAWSLQVVSQPPLCYFGDWSIWANRTACWELWVFIPGIFMAFNLLSGNWQWIIEWNHKLVALPAHLLMLLWGE